MSYPQYEPYPPVAVPAPAPGGGTAITAGVLASLGSVSQLLGGGMSIVLGVTDVVTDLADYDSTGLFAQHWFKPYSVVTGVIAVIAAILLGVGAVMMFVRKPLGRVLVVAGCAVVVIAGIAGSVVTLRYTTSGGGAATIGGGISGLIGLVFPIATAILALVPSTTRWLNYDPAAAYVPPVARYPYPAAPPPGPGYSPGSAVQQGPTPYPPAPPAYPQYGPSAGAPAPYPQHGPSGGAPAPYPQAGSAYPGSDQAPTQVVRPAGAPPDWSASPQAAPASQRPDLVKPQDDLRKPQPDLAQAQPDVSRPQPDLSKPQEGPAKPQEGPAKPQEGPAKPQEGPAKPQDDPAKPQEGPAKPQDDPTVRIEDSPWRRPPSE
ncbi:hypothetical protein [Nocardia nepalensis]|uniref:hypothetical protein n=1 Tax=Nocardia nepalensis TaxID=3375448 RepID=UPI003B679E3C